MCRLKRVDGLTASRRFHLPSSRELSHFTHLLCPKTASWIESRANTLRTKRVSIVAMAALGCVATPTVMRSQAPTRLSLDQAKAMARLSSPDLRAAREETQAARGRELQAGALSNPVLTYSTERTSGSGQSNGQQIAGAEQRIEVGGQRGARRAVAFYRRRATEARAEATQASIDFDVASAYAHAIAADRRVRTGPL